MEKGFVYTQIKSRDTRLYSISGSEISSGGLESGWIKMYLGIVVFALFINVIAFFVTGGIQGREWVGTIYLNPLRDGDFKPIPIIFTFIIPGMITSLLYGTEIQGYRTIEFLLAFLKPRNIYNKRLQKQQFENYKVKGLVENINIF